ncbi:hypothetical protein HSB1_15630 [Halogranum salarium B-1]|uniref:Uncharacterized protein n=1 Tax=Halogranum salarium B-1 TaxID=1210908 RepID=J2ZJR1_9EURY|nr:hypothetical protein HSB1_15630 [Halogranum salarium B-1]
MQSRTARRCCALENVLTESHASGCERGASQVVNEVNVLTEI